MSNLLGGLSIPIAGGYIRRHGGGYGYFKGTYNILNPMLVGSTVEEVQAKVAEAGQAAVVPGSVIIK